MKAWALPAGALLAAFAAIADPARDDAELARTWDEAIVFAPGPDGPIRLNTSDLAGRFFAAEAPPVVVYLHGCDGPSRITVETASFLAGAGWLVAAPDSFARLDKPKSCDAPARRSGLHRAVLGWRHAEIGHAIAAIRDFPALAGSPVALMGHSEGAIAVATFTGESVSARVIEGWTCHAGWPEYRGLAAPPEEPVLSLLGADDPWFLTPALRGDCGAFMDDNDRSVVFREPFYLHDRHWLTADSEVRALVVSFLK